MNLAEAQKLVASHPWWYHKFEIFPGVITPGVYDPIGLLDRLNLPMDMSGTRVLDIGPSDGYFSKSLVNRGADVTSMDYRSKDYSGFGIMEQLAEKPMKFVECNIYDIARNNFQPFDFVLCFGVLYHLADMIRAMWALRPYCKGQLLLETLVSRKHDDEPYAEYLYADSCNKDHTNFWSPNPLCVQKMMADCGFVVEETVPLVETRFLFRCRRDDQPAAGYKVQLGYI